MNLPPLPLVGGALFVDNSMLELLQTCPRALEYNRLRLRVAANDKPSLSFGSAIHLALEHRYRTYQSGVPDYDCEEEQTKILTKHFEQHPSAPDDWRTLNWAVEIMRRYNLRYQAEPFSLLAPSHNIHDDKGNVIAEAGKPLVELPFALPLFTYIMKDGTSVLIVYSGKIDLPTLEEQLLLVTDHKTSSMLGNQFFERAAMLAQMKGYMWAFEKITGMKVHGYRINAIRTKEPPMKVTAGGKASEVEKWWSETFMRQTYHVTPDEVEEWRLNAIALVEEMFWHYERGYMPMKTAWCCVYGKCQYYDVCTLPRVDRLEMLRSGMYTTNEWSPLKSPSAPQV